MKRNILLLFIVISLLFPRGIFAESSYVLPYPDVMPGNISYKAKILYEYVMKYWYFGDFGKLKYNLSLADKYLVEAKTLFEYKQYLLAVNALKKSDEYFQNIAPLLQTAKSHKKDVNEKSEIIKNASEKHTEVLQQLIRSVPSEFEWVPEKQPSTKLDLHKMLYNSINIRSYY